MRHIPRKADDSVNVSKEHPLIEASTLVVGLSLIFVTLMILAVFVVEIVLYFVPEKTEVELFGAWLPDDLIMVADDDSRLAELDALMDRLAAHWPETEYEFRVQINDSSAPNALAFPGGLIVVTSGLLDSVQSENELAFVLGHEMGHFRNRDHIRGLGRGLAIGILISAVSSNDGGARLGATVADLTLKGYSRRQERAADAFGLLIVQREYGHVADAWRFFERIEEAHGSTGDIASLLSTHPSPDDRAERLIELAGENGWPITGETTELGW